MIKRRKTKTAKVANVRIGSGNPVVIQSMTNVPTTDIDLCVRQVNQLAQAGCQLVRVAVPTEADTKALAAIIQQVNVPIIADIHFSPARAIEAIEAGAAKIRLNPGNIKEKSDILRIIDAAKQHKIAMRVGVNEASIRDLKTADIKPEKRVALMLTEMKKYIKLFEGRGFSNIVLSAKSSDTIRTIEINRLLAKTFDYPIHLGLTHAGLPEDAKVPTAIALGTLLSEGIGDTIRVSLAGDPVNEVTLAEEILIPLELLPRTTVELIVCPTCGRAQIDVVQLAAKVKASVTHIDKHLRIAVMGCIVNGPGEAADADLAICAAKNKGYLYRRGQKLAAVPEDQLLDALLKELQNL
jgi:(E)-4-hydroxy-3-methylbut-2-enyl-diphosphate synthase